jgi:hypothetical protein
MGSPQERPNGAHVPPGLSFVLGRLESSSTARVAAGAFGFLILIQVFDGQINSPVFEERFCAISKIASNDPSPGLRWVSSANIMRDCSWRLASNWLDRGPTFMTKSLYPFL